MKIGQNLGNIGKDTLERYIATPVKSGHPERLLIGLPLAVINGTARAIDGVLAGVADQEIDVPDGTFAETGRDLSLTKSHLLPPKPIKLATDVIRLPGTLTSGFLDALGGFDTRKQIQRTLSV